MRISILGSGSWGLALSGLLAENGHRVTIWGRDAEKINQMRKSRKISEYLPGYEINAGIALTDSLEEAAEGADMVVFSTASAGVRETARKLAAFWKGGPILVSVSKGIEPGTLETMTSVIVDEIPGAATAALSGPSHAEEVAAGLPTTCVTAAVDEETALQVQDVFMSDRFRVYAGRDLLGLELGGALKNVIALAAGISDGMSFGDNTKAALMTRGIAEIARLGKAMGADTHTFSGLSGIGDLIVTCGSMYSRNRRAGILLGKGKTLAEALAEIHMTVEGVNTTKAAYALAARYNVEMPITNEIYHTLFRGKSPAEAVAALMSREKRAEYESDILSD